MKTKFLLFKLGNIISNYNRDTEQKWLHKIVDLAKNSFNKNQNVRRRSKEVSFSFYVIVPAEHISDMYKTLSALIFFLFLLHKNKNPETIKKD